MNSKTATLKIKVRDLQFGDLIHCAEDTRAKFISFGGYPGFTTYAFCSGRPLHEPVPLVTDRFTDEIPADNIVTVDREEAPTRWPRGGAAKLNPYRGHNEENQAD